MKLFDLRFDTLMIRYYLMMASVIVGGFTGMWWIAFLAFPIFMSCLLGLNFSRQHVGSVSRPLSVRKGASTPDDAEMKSAA